MKVAETAHTDMYPDEVTCTSLKNLVDQTLFYLMFHSSCDLTRFNARKELLERGWKNNSGIWSNDLKKVIFSAGEIIC